MKLKFVVAGILFLVFVFPLLSTPIQEERQTSSFERYLVLHTVKLATLQRELDQAAAAGYRVVYGNAGSYILILEKTSNHYQYRFVHGLKKKLGPAAADGFSAIPTTFSAVGDSVIVEKPEGANDVHDYLVLQTFRSSTLQNELNDGAARGYELVAISTYAMNSALMEKRSANTAAASGRYLLLAASRTSSMQNEITEAAAQGYAVIAGSGGNELNIVMEKTERAPEYRLLATTRTVTLEKEINQSAAAGFRPVPRTLLATIRPRNTFSSFLPDETVIIMEKVERPEPVTYKIFGTRLPATFMDELAQAANEGFEMIDFALSSSEQVGLLQRIGTPPAPQPKRHESRQSDERTPSAPQDSDQPGPGTLFGQQ